MRKPVFLAVALAVLAATLSGCGGDSAGDVATPTAVPTEASAPTVAPTADSAAASDVVEVPTQFSGTGSVATARFKLERGRTSFRIQHDGVGDLVVLLNDNEENIASLLADSAYASITGAYDETRTVNLIFEGLFFLQVTTDGTWSVDVTPE
jgi:hypothetical protein